MTQEERQLLLKDLCARLPYNIKLGFENSNIVLIPKDYCYFTQQLFSTLMFPEHIGIVEYGYPIYEYRPYLRPMSSMTEEEIDRMWEIYDSGPAAESSAAVTEYLYERSLDCHHLIEKGLALEAPKNMYKTE